MQQYGRHQANQKNYQKPWYDDDCISAVAEGKNALQNAVKQS